MKERYKKSKYKKKQTPQKNIRPRIENSKTDFYIYTGLIFLILISFFPTFKAGIVSWDDYGYLIENKSLIESFSLKEIFSTFAVMGNYHPVTILFYSIQYQIAGGLNPTLFHTTNILFHIFNTILIFILLKNFNAKKITALIVSILFAIHPLHVESVSWISELKDVLYTFFLLLSFIFYLKYKKSKPQANKYYIISIVLFIFSCLSKGMAVVLPLLLIITDYFIDKKISIKKQVNKIPFLIISFIFGLIAFYAQKASKGVISLTDYDFIETLLFPIYSFGFYIIKMFLPINLSIFYPYPEPNKLNAIHYFSIVLLIGYLAAIYFSFKKKKYHILFGLLFYLSTILFVIQIKPIGNAIAADRYFYLSSIGLFYIIAYFISNRYEKIKNKKANKILFQISLLFITLILSITTFNRTKIWENTETLWKSVLKVYPKSDIAYYGLAYNYDKKGNRIKAKEFYKKAIDLNMHNKKANVNLGNMYYNNNQFDSALLYYQQSIKNNTDYAEGYYSIGNIYYIKNDYKKAINYYLTAIKYNKNYSLALYQIAVSYINQNKNKEAKKYLIRAAKLNFQPAIQLLNKNF